MPFIAADGGLVPAAMDTACHLDGSGERGQGILLATGMAGAATRSKRSMRALLPTMWRSRGTATMQG